MATHRTIRRQQQIETEISHEAGRPRLYAVLVAAGLLVLGVVVAGVTFGVNADPTVAQKASTAAVLNICVLVFREGLECVLVLSAITASMTVSRQNHARPVAAGAAIAAVATLITWRIAVSILDDLNDSIPALECSGWNWAAGDHRASHHHEQVLS